MIKLVIFDLDGTLLNSLEDLADSCNYLLRKYGFPEHPLDSYRYFVGDGIRKLVERVLPEEKRQKAFIEQFFQEMVAYYDIHKEDKTMPYPGIVETLETLQKQGIMLGVASNKINKAMMPLMEHYFPTIRFTCVLGQREGIPVKPNPQIVFDIMKIAEVAAEETLYVGDTDVDMDTAHGAGLKAVGALWGYRDRQELAEHHAEYIIAKPVELVELTVNN
jgi:phosphoglycolate phosphatase